MNGIAAYLGPDGSFSHLVTRQCFPNATLRPFPTVPEVFEFIATTESATGIVPIENSSGGMIIPTVDSLIEHAGSVFANEMISLDVKLALLGRTGRAPEVVYSHSVPLQHCAKWLRRTYPHARALAANSTSHAAKLAAVEENAAAIGQRDLAAAHGLDVLHFPIEEHIPNVTQFYIISRTAAADGDRSAYIVALPNVAGSLYRFLAPFNDHGVNLTRIQSRPVFGVPDTHRFFIELACSEPAAAAALAAARAPEISSQVESLGSFPAARRFQS